MRPDNACGFAKWPHFNLKLIIPSMIFNQLCFCHSNNNLSPCSDLMLFVKMYITYRLDYVSKPMFFFVFFDMSDIFCE